MYSIPFEQDQKQGELTMQTEIKGSCKEVNRNSGTVTVSSKIMETVSKDALVRCY